VHNKFRKAQGVVLKKQNYRETDQIVTIWTDEFGKIRVLARGVRKSSSKMAGALQDLALVRIEVTGKWPTLTSAQTVRNFRGIRENLAKVAPAYYACELVMKMTADEHPEQKAYDLLVDFLQDLSSASTEFQAYTMIDIFALDLADILGYGRPKEIGTHHDVRNFIEGLIERNIKSEPFLLSI
jgi:DNA repair protein RecO (recombination protein O)